MTADRIQKLDRLVLAAAVLRPEERSAFLAGLDHEPAELVAMARYRIASLEEIPEGFLKTLATGVRDAVLSTPEDDDVAPPVGGDRYDIGECLGRGGMADVYRAFDRRLGRHVALKVLRSQNRAARGPLIAEARAQARINHDHVLEIYDTGDFEGRPFIAMRYADGGTLADLPADAPLHHKVHLVAQAADGLQAAHDHGLVHGDVKPSNILVGGSSDGPERAWIGDFGIATDLDESNDNEVRPAIAGTPPFMAPELLRGKRSADRRSDVFSLGVTLCSVLTRRYPDRRDDGSVDPHPAITALPPELGAIVSRCLANEPDNRYPSAHAVALELRRFIDGQVVEAYADRLSYRLLRYSIRHRRHLVVAGVFTAALVLALAIAGVMGIQAIQANQRAEDRRLQAEDLIEFMLTDLRGRLDAVGRLDLLNAVGDRALQYFAAVPEAELSDADLARRAAALYQIGDVRIRQGDLSAADQPLRESLALARRLAERDPSDPERLYDLAQSEFWVGFAAWERGNLDTAEHHFLAYRDLAERLVTIDATNREWRRELAYAHSNLGSIRQHRGNLSEALARFQQTLEIDVGLVADAPTPDAERSEQFELSATHNTVGVILEEMGRLGAAEHHYRADLDIREHLSTVDPGNRRHQEFLGTSHQHLGTLLLKRCDLAESRRHLEAAHAVFVELATYDPENLDWQYKLVWNQLQLGRHSMVSGRESWAASWWSRAASLSGALAAADPERFDWQVGAAVAGLHLARSAKEPTTAHQLARNAVDSLTKLSQRRPEDRACRMWLADGLMLLGILEHDFDALAATESDDARQRWRDAAGVLEPVVMTGGRWTQNHRLLFQWATINTRLDRINVAVEALARLDETDFATPFEHDVLQLTACLSRPGNPMSPSEAIDKPEPAMERRSDR